MSDTWDKPKMNWAAADLPREWQRFVNHCDFTFKGPLSGKTEVVKVNYLMGFIGDHGREVYETFDWKAAEGDTPAENDTLKGVYDKFSAYVQPKKKPHSIDSGIFQTQARARGEV